MANVNVTFWADGELNNIQVTPSSRQQLQPGDTVTFIHSAAAGANVTVSLSGFLSDRWTSSSTLLLGRGQSAVKTIKSSPVYSNGSITLSASGYSSGSFLFETVSNVDTTPDQFDLGPHVNGANPNREYFSNEISVTGINTTVSAVVTNAKMSINNGAYVTTQTPVKLNDRIRLLITSHTAYGGSKTATLQVGSTSDNLVITNKADPDSGEIIYAPFTALPIKLTDVGLFFGVHRDPTDAYNLDPQLSHYIKGGDFVPNISANSAVPSALPIKLTQLVGSATSLYFEVLPNSKSHGVNTVGSAQTMTLTWNGATGDFGIGFGKGMRDACELKFDVVVTNTPLNRTASEVSITSQFSTHSTYKKGNWWLTLTASAPFNSEGEFVGTVTISARHPEKPLQVISETIAFRLFYYGP